MQRWRSGALGALVDKRKPRHGVQVGRGAVLMSWAVVEGFVAGWLAGALGVFFVLAYSRPKARRTGNGDCGAVGGVVGGDEPPSTPVSLEEKNNSVSSRS